MNNGMAARGVALLMLLTACSRDHVPAASGQPTPVAVPQYADAWQTVRDERWGVELRLHPDVTYVQGPTSSICDDTVFEMVTVPQPDSIAEGEVGVSIYLTHTVFGNGIPETFGWRRATDWNPEAEPGWEVYGEGPSEAGLEEGNGWFGLGGEPLVKIFLNEDECIAMMDLDSAAIDSVHAESGEITCGSVHDTRPRYMAVVRRPSDGCYLMLTRTDGAPVGDIAETVRFIENGRLVAPVGMQPARRFSFRTDAGIAATLSEHYGCVILRNPAVTPGTPLTMISLALEDEEPQFSFVGEPEPNGCGPAPAGHSDGSDTTRWYAYRLGYGIIEDSHHMYQSSGRPLIALIGHQLDRDQLDSLRITRDSIRLRDRTDPRAIRLLIDLDRDGVQEAFAERDQGDSIVFTITRGTAANAPVVWRATFPQKPTTVTLPSPASALNGRVERGANGEVCLTIANPRIPYLTPIEVTRAGGGKANAYVAWRPPGGCSATQQPRERGYGLMLADTGALAIGENATGRVVVD